MPVTTDRKPTRHVDMTVNVPALAMNCHQEGSIRLCSGDTDRFVNIYAKNVSTVDAATVRDLRDALNAIYPEETAKRAPQPTKKPTPKGAQAYKGNGKHKWEVVAVDAVTHTQRLRVPGGWLFMTNTINDEMDTHNTNTVFVPVPEVVGYAV